MRPFDPQRPRTGSSVLFNFAKDNEAAVPLLSLTDMRLIRASAGLQGDELRAFWAEHWNKDKLDLDALFPFIVKAAWRLTRGLEMVRGRMQPDTFLNELPIEEWETPAPGLAPGGQNSIERALVNTQLSLLPPAPDPSWLNGDKDASYYDPSQDAALMDHLGLLARIANKLGIELTKEGRYGLMPLLDPAMVRQAWPTPRELMAYENLILDEAVQAVLENGHFGALRHLREKHGFDQWEASSMLLLARRGMRGMRNGADSDGDKSMMVARLEDLAARCRTSLDLRAELMTYKALAIVQGITKTQGTEEDVDGMVEIAGEVIGAEEDDDDESESAE